MNHSEHNDTKYKLKHWEDKPTKLNIVLKCYVEKLFLKYSTRKKYTKEPLNPYLPMSKHKCVARFHVL